MDMLKKKTTSEKSAEKRLSAVNIAVPGSSKKQPDTSVEHNLSDAQAQQATGAPSQDVKSNLPAVEVIGGLSGMIFNKIDFVFHRGKVFAVFNKHGQPVGLNITDRRVKRVINTLASQLIADYKRSDLKGLLEDINAIAEDYAEKRPVYHRYAPLSNGDVGVEIDLCNPAGDRITVSSKGWFINE